jgi:alpha-glucosidase
MTGAWRIVSGAKPVRGEIRFEPVTGPGRAAFHRVLARIPTTWDDTRALECRVGEFAMIARRSGTDWHVGAMTDGSDRSLSLNLDFLRPGPFQMEPWHDTEDAAPGVGRRVTRVTRDQSLPLRLAAHGGAYLSIRPAAE